jgi:hypothetical protein
MAGEGLMQFHETKQAILDAAARAKARQFDNDIGCTLTYIKAQQRRIRALEEARRLRDTFRNWERGHGSDPAS